MLSQYSINPEFIPLFCPTKCKQTTPQIDTCFENTGPEYSTDPSSQVRFILCYLSCSNCKTKSKTFFQRALHHKVGQLSRGSKNIGI